MEAIDTREGHPRRRAILAVLCLSLLIVVIDNTILNTALPTLARGLKASTTDLQWFTDAYTLTFAALLVLAICVQSVSSGLAARACKAAIAAWI